MSTVYSAACSDQEQNAKAPHNWPFVMRIHRPSVDSPDKWPVMRFPSYDVIMPGAGPLLIQNAYITVITIPADVLTPSGARPSADTVPNEN